MTSSNEKSEWQKLDWEKKVAICQQGAAHEDSLLITYVVIFIALEAMFFAAFFNLKPPSPWNIVIAALGIVVAIECMYIFYRRGKCVDVYATVLRALWQDIPEDEVLAKVEDFEVKAKCIKEIYGSSCAKRLAKGWRGTFCGWLPWCEWFKHFHTSPRRFLTKFMPVLVIVIWALTICHVLDP